MTAGILDEVAAERQRHATELDGRRLPLLDPTITSHPHRSVAEAYELPTSLRAAEMQQIADDRSRASWLHLLTSAMSDFMGAAPDVHIDSTQARADLVRIAALAAGAIEEIDFGAAS